MYKWYQSGLALDLGNLVYRDLKTYKWYQSGLALDLGYYT